MKTFIKIAAISAALGTAACAAYADGHVLPINATETKAGTVLTDKNGMSLYTFDKDSSGASNCNGGCAKSWPPVLASGKAHDEGAFTVITRADGSRQWAFNGAPLYGWQGDRKPGDVTGDGVGGTWHLARP